MTATSQRKGLWVAGWLAFAALTLWFSFHIHSRSAPFTYKSQIFADKAGYYIYLPATFVFGFDADAVPDSLSEKVGNGFLITEQNKIYTKYPIGVSLMQSPFFLLAHGVLAPLTGQPADGFSPVYHAMVDVAAWAYMLLGMGMLLIVLRRRHSLGRTLGTLTLLLLGTNLAYYYSTESGMSHIYSFCVVSALILLLDRIQACHVACPGKVGKRIPEGAIHPRHVERSPEGAESKHLAHTDTTTAHPSPRLSPLQALALGGLCGLLVVTRFTNVFLISLVLAWGVRDLQSLWQRIRLILAPRTLPLLLVGPAILIGLQMAYYHYLTGSLFLYSYGDEGFDFLHPELLKALFSPNNGLFPHAPMVLFGLIGLGIMAARREALGWYGIGLFALCAYIFSCWWQWYFGCAFGQRSYVELYPILAFGIAQFLQWVSERTPRPVQILTWSVLILLCLLVTNHMYHFKLCYIGQGDWDWGYWWGEVVRV